MLVEQRENGEKCVLGGVIVHVAARCFSYYDRMCSGGIVTKNQSTVIDRFHIGLVTYNVYSSNLKQD